MVDTPSQTDTIQAALDLAMSLAVAQAQAAYPYEDARIQAGAQLVLDGHVTQEHGYAQVRSRSSAQIYRVAATCECPAASFHPAGYHCAHRWAKSLHKKAAQYLGTLWYATYHEAPGILHETSTGAYAWFAIDSTTTYQAVAIESPHLVVCGHAAEVIEQAQLDAQRQRRMGIER
jgi:tRNA(Leu) C34 or U34 (ribose-2'-O)-methylase TrmL